MLRFVLIMLITVLPVIAFAEPIETLPVSARTRPGFSASGIRFGSVIIRPAARMTEMHSDNIYATDAIKRSDFVTNIAPAITAQTLNNKRGFKFDLDSEHALYKNNSRENYTDFGMSLAPYLQLTKISKLDAKLGFEREHDARTAEASSNNIGAEEPVRWNRSIGRLGWQYKPGQTGLTTFVQHAIRHYENVAALNGGPSFINNDRDRSENEIGAEISHDLTDRNRLYLAGNGFSRDYRRNDFDLVTGGYTGLSRDSTGYDLRVGTNFDLTSLIRLNVNGGYYNQDFSSNGFKNIQTAVTAAKATWMVTSLTTVDFGAKREVFETNQSDASAFIQSAATAEINHEFRRNIVIGIEAAKGKNTYIGSTREDEFWGAGPKIVYKMNRNIDWKAGYLYDSRKSNQFGADYDRQRIYAGIQVKF